MVTVVKMRVQCPQCANKFKAQDIWGVCPHCGYECERPGDAVISLPAIRSATTKATDKVYRDMEAASEVRAQQAADMAGVPVSEMSHLKITDLRDNVQVGETYAKPVNNPVTQHMEQMQARGMPVGFQANGEAFAANVNQGFAPRAGASMLDKVNPGARSNKLGATFR